MHFARTIPRGVGLKFFSMIGTTASRIFRKDRDRAVANLALAFPETPSSMRSALANAMFKTLGKNFYEFLNLEGSSAERVAGLIETIDGWQHIDEAMKPGKGLIVITGHIGCFELLAAYFAKQGYKLSVVGRELWEKRLNARLLQIRESMGYRTIDRNTGGKDVLRVLKNGEVLAILIDQHTQVSGIYVPFFNRPAHTPTGVARLAVATGSPVLPMAIYMRHDGRHEIRILPPVKPPGKALDKNQKTEELTRRCSLAIEELVRYDPKQWVWFHNRWRETEEMRAEV